MHAGAWAEEGDCRVKTPDTHWAFLWSQLADHLELCQMVQGISALAHQRTGDSDKYTETGNRCGRMGHRARRRAVSAHRRACGMGER